MRTRITKAVTLVAASAALLSGAALATAGTAAAATTHTLRPVASRMAPHHRTPVRTERVWVKGHYVTVRGRHGIRREWVKGHYAIVAVRGR
ncbi:hypothetical protein [Streptacidiphilus sp. P02-A3a]|uniref:hypothetical protein n=1 Tax=Streptacidiphilus sp. P02-A3a TaxID=2704468 RepID=UPI0015FB74EE|nr:hypothetical protein [Streptacidiphilus sp. P02-A3a]QMU73191.1 hypothetical protein GXP74_38145 [Streptacidiphilus sp. P02-A3a]